MGEVLIKVGMGALSPPARTQALMEVVLKLLTEKATCQLHVAAVDEGEKAGTGDDGDDEESDHDTTLMDSVCDLIGCIAKVMGDLIVPYFDAFVPALQRLCKSSRPYNERAMSIGCFAEVVAELSPVALKYSPIIIPLIRSALGDKMVAVRRNAVFCIGVFAGACGESLASSYVEMLGWLRPLLARRDENAENSADIDNALAAVCRMILACSAAVPMAHVLPVVLSNLPLREDHDENPAVFRSLMYLLAIPHEAMLANLPAAMTAFAQCLSPGSKASQAVKDDVSAGLKAFFASPHGAQGVAAVNSLDASLQATLSQALA